MIQLRGYQQRAIEDLYRWFYEHEAGNPCLVLPTGAGKSIIIAELCRDALVSWPGTRILILSHVKELLQQDTDKILAVWTEAPLGIYSAGLNRKELNQITVAGIQSIRKRALKVGHVDLVIVDEAHLISHKDEGGYRSFIKDLHEINPALRVIGLTATPYRLGHGLITDKPALFDALIEPVSLRELIDAGYLAPLHSKGMDLLLSVDGVDKRGGDFIEEALQKVVNTKENNAAIVDQTLSISRDRRSILVFCSGVDHAYAMRDEFRRQGETAEAVLGDTPSEERARILEDFKAGRVRVVTNNSVLTTGFDAPDTDVLVMARPTESTVLYVQSAGRGMRPKKHSKDCLVLDFAGNVRRHGPITELLPPRKKGEKRGEAPVKLCEECQELVPISARTCPACGWEFPPPPKKTYKLHNDDIMGGKRLLDVDGWRWRRHITSSGKECATVTYYSGADAVTEYLLLLHGGYPEQKAISLLDQFQRKGGVAIMNPYDLDEVVEAMGQATPPALISVEKDGKYDRVTGRQWMQ
ncbi:MAG: DEAD/DEAH box helicase family protein [Synergistaceae bacterium]|nr:DEAD/DEAH box helicase family protein [Synergistaceae bacterium]